MLNKNPPSPIKNFSLKRGGVLLNPKIFKVGFSCYYYCLYHIVSLSTCNDSIYKIPMALLYYHLDNLATFTSVYTAYNPMHSFLRGLRPRQPLFSRDPHSFWPPKKSAPAAGLYQWQNIYAFDSGQILHVTEYSGPGMTNPDLTDRECPVRTGHPRSGIFRNMSNLTTIERICTLNLFWILRNQINIWISFYSYIYRYKKWYKFQVLKKKEQKITRGDDTYVSKSESKGVEWIRGAISGLVNNTVI